MGGGGGRTVEYVSAPTPQSAPERTAEEKAFLDEQRQQMDQMQTSYRDQLAALQNQYNNSQQQSTSVIDQLKASADLQRQAADRTRQDLESASTASAQQLQLLAASRDQATGQLAQSRTDQANRVTSMRDRLNRRRAARRPNQNQQLLG